MFSVEPLTVSSTIRTFWWIQPHTATGYVSPAIECISFFVLLNSDALFLPLINSGTSLLAGFAIFSIIGFMAHVTGRSVGDVVDKGPSLAFVVIPEAAAKIPYPAFWSLVFFIMLLATGFDCQASCGCSFHCR